jgi:hypothetical protein
MSFEAHARELDDIDDVAGGENRFEFIKLDQSAYPTPQFKTRSETIKPFEGVVLKAEFVRSLWPSGKPTADRRPLCQSNDGKTGTIAESDEVRICKECPRKIGKGDQQGCGRGFLFTVARLEDEQIFKLRTEKTSFPPGKDLVNDLKGGVPYRVIYEFSSRPQSKNALHWMVFDWAAIKELGKDDTERWAEVRRDFFGEGNFPADGEMEESQQDTAPSEADVPNFSEPEKKDPPSSQGKGDEEVVWDNFS